MANKLKSVNNTCQVKNKVGIYLWIEKGLRERKNELPRRYTYPAIFKLGLETAEKIIANR